MKKKPKGKLMNFAANLKRRSPALRYLDTSLLHRASCKDTRNRTWVRSPASQNRGWECAENGVEVGGVRLGVSHM